MGWLTKSRTVIRSLSIFYLFLGILAVVLLFFFMGIIPANEAELNERAHRALNQFVENVLEKDKEVRGLFATADNTVMPDFWNHIISHGQNFENLDHLPYTADTFRVGHYNNKLPVPGSRFVADSAGNWQWTYYSKWTAGNLFLEVHINISDFAGPVLDARNDIFDTYLLLLDSPQTSHGRNLPLIYSKDNKTPSYFVNHDSLTSLQKNSDGSATGSVFIGGNEYKIFYTPFKSCGQKLLLAGLLDAGDYIKRTRQTPLDFIPVSIIVILLLLIAMPFIKIFLLDRRETLTYRDMALAGFSFYLGPGCFCLILFYTICQLVNTQTYSTRLNKLGQDLQSSVNRNISSAYKRLVSYDCAVDKLSLTSKLTVCLTDPSDNSSNMEFLDNMMAPLSDRHTTRVFWIDSSGHTLAKWNPFDFVSPLTDVSGYAYYKRFTETNPPTDPKTSSFCLVYAGKSNATGEFQVFILKPSCKVFLVNRKKVKSMAVVEAINLDISEHVILPLGFGFCLVDQQGNILVDSDPLLDLSGNVLEESGENSLLAGSLAGGNPGSDIRIPLYGDPHTAHVFPIKGQALSMVVYFDQEITSQHIIRLLLFSIQSSVWLALAILLCILLSTYQKTAPGKLMFCIRPVEWIRPVSINEDSYGFTFYYFGGMLLLYLLFLFLFLSFVRDLRPLYGISLLLPFYGIWGFIISRSKSGGEVSWWQALEKIFKLGFYPAVFVVVINLVLSRAMDTMFWLLIFEGLAFLILWSLIRWFPIKSFEKIELLYKNQNSFLPSLMGSMFLVSILPTVGILLYGYSAEMLQCKKQNQLSYAVGLAGWEEFVHDDLSVGYKDAVKISLNKTAYSHDSFMINGDKLDTLETGEKVNAAGLQPLPDNTYAKIINEAGILAGVDNSFLALGQNSNDESWSFQMAKDPSPDKGKLILYYRPTESGSLVPVIRVRSKMNRLAGDFLELPTAFILFCFLVIILAVLVSAKVVKATIKRLFLLNIIRMDSIQVEQNYITGILNQEPVRTSFLKDMEITKPVMLDFFKTETDLPKNPDKKPRFSQEEYILALADCFSAAYEKIWRDLSPAQRFTLYDFCEDYYTNYKNVGVFISLIQKGIILGQGNTWVVFSMSFRQFILSKKDSLEIKILMKKFRIGGTWEAFRIPVLSLIAVTGVIIFATQSQLSHQLLAMLTSLTALMPLVLKLFQRSTGTAV